MNIVTLQNWRIILTHKKEYEDIYDNQSLLEIVGKIRSVKRYKLDKTDRLYDVYKVSGNKDSVVIKETRKRNEVIMNRYVHSLNLDFVPHLYYVENKIDCHHLCMTSLNETNKDYTIDHIKDLIRKINLLHNQYYEYKHDSLYLDDLKTWQVTSDDVVESILDKEITRQDIKCIQWSQEVLKHSKKSIIHGDMIILNSMLTDKGMVLFDWEHGQFGPTMIDIGRLLGDYNIDKKWINSDWEDELLEFYYHLNSNENMMSYSQFRLEFECAKLYNYTGIVVAFKTRNIERNRWYDLNLREMKKSIAGIKRLKKEMIEVGL